MSGGAASYRTYMYFNGTEMADDGGSTGGSYGPPDGHLVFGRDMEYDMYYSTFVIDEFSVWDTYLGDDDLQIMIDHYLNM